MSLTSNSRRWFTRLVCLGACWLPVLGSAADYPTRPITIVVGYSPGGANDVLARIVAEKLAVSLGQSVVVENRPGVGAIVGALRARNEFDIKRLIGLLKVARS